MKLENCEVHSYHAFYNKYYDHCHDDTMMRNILRKRMKPKQNYTFNMIILDEAQDITPVYYESICKIIKDNNKKVNIAVFGDRKQSIYSFNNADSRFIEYANNLFCFGSKYTNTQWKNVNFDITFRLSDKIADFVNNCILDNDSSAVKLTSPSKNATTSKVRYIMCNQHMENNTTNKVYLEIKKLLKD